jgi:hypothetical protein
MNDQPEYCFSHEKLDVYRGAIEFIAWLSLLGGGIATWGYKGPVGSRCKLCRIEYRRRQWEVFRQGSLPILRHASWFGARMRRGAGHTRREIESDSRSDSPWQGSAFNESSKCSSAS